MMALIFFAIRIGQVRAGSHREGERPGSSFRVGHGRLRHRA